MLWEQYRGQKCEQAGTVIFWCLDCYYIVYKLPGAAPALGHDLTYKYINDQVHEVNCKRDCGYWDAHPKTEEHRIRDVVVSQSGTYGKCGYTEDIMRWVIQVIGLGLEGHELRKLGL